MKKLFFTIIMFHSFYAFSQSADETAKQFVLESINKFFLSLEKKDTVLYSSIILPGGQIWTVRRMNDSLKTTMRSFESDLGALVKMNSIIEERPLSYDITIHNDIAIAWVPYTLSMSSKFSHCGVDVFTLVKTNKGWKIVSLAYSVEPGGCESLSK